jgi:hypothetical protein
MMTHADVIEGAAHCGRDPRNLHAHTTDVMEGAAHFWAEPSQTGLHFWGGGEAVLEQEPVWEEEAGIEIMVMEEVTTI